MYCRFSISICITPAPAVTGLSAATTLTTPTDYSTYTNFICFSCFFVNCPLYFLALAGAHAGRNSLEATANTHLVVLQPLHLGVVVFFRLDGKCSGLIHIQGDQTQCTPTPTATGHLLSIFSPSSFTVSTDSTSFCLEEWGRRDELVLPLHVLLLSLSFSVCIREILS
ncbi:hypothetical protein BO82DRAFT_30558 [Aspergillus uvarum CBS 121591]|uniref:Uncharacterized protein n=1 Tax=Aspergillus uvarum CBS 121591 TaxID=1448315 RepID=A0A319CEB6_9EURO|nr:hypothetical protein BO82DRAFT_30558 [Aspergillus uvarum CBS 121591]PYH84015.1 hypothetical protein BO82DRAFT_30558 [Aspergillus uvarum CBS 121591]